MNIDSSEMKAILRFERAAFHRQLDVAVKLLHQLAIDAEGTLLGAAGEESRFREYIYTRLAAAIIALLSDPKLPLKVENYYRLSMCARALEALFRQTPFRNLDHLLEVAGIRCSEGQLDPASITTRVSRVQLMLSRTLSSRVPIGPSELFGIGPHLAAVTGLNCLSSKAVVSLETDAEKRKWLDAAPLFKDVSLPLRPDFLSRLSAAWMMCSYIDAHNKHDIKESVNSALRGEMVKGGLNYIHELPPRQRERVPTLGVVIEVMHGRHAMFRCHARELQSLREKFHLVLVTIGPKPFPEVRALFHEEMLFDANSIHDFNRMVHDVARRGFDLIYYPSVGMRYWAVLMANLRLAPIQFFSIGHPATTRSPFMDYIVMYAGYMGEASAFSERIVLLPDEALCYDPPANGGRCEPVIHEQPDVIRVAVPSKVFKLTAAFMSRCLRIQSECGRKLEFQFFPNERSDLYHFDILNEIRRWFPDAVVHRTTTYERYIELLNICDIALSPYPFGGINSTVDCLRQGIPVVTQIGAEPHSRLDSLPMRLMGLPEWLFAADEAAYEAAAIRLIRNDEERVAISGHLVQRDVDSVLFRPQPAQFATLFADVVWALYDHHDEIQGNPQQVWLHEELSRLTPSGERECDNRAGSKSGGSRAVEEGVGAR